jgi:DNA-binding PadR family transcriptional regulator
MTSLHQDVDFYKTQKDTTQGTPTAAQTLRKIKQAYYAREEASQHELLQRHWRQAIGILAKRGARFVVIKRGSKLPTRKGWNLTENTLTKQQALEHLDAGDNISHAAGTGDLYFFDFDYDAERGHECAQLSGGLYFYRENATRKAKFVFSCPEPIPTRLKSKTHGIDLLGINANGTHAQGVIAGMHNSGVPVRWGGHTVPVLSAETVAALWEEWTDADLFATEKPETHRDTTYATADLARVADALKYVDPNDMDYTTWQGIIAAIHDAFGDDALDMVVDWADGKPGEVETKWHTYEREYTGKPATLDTVFYLARKGGWPDTWLQDRLREYRCWLASPEAIGELKEAGFKNPARAIKLLDTILQDCEDRKRLRVKPGYAALARKSGIGPGSLNGKDGYLARLAAPKNEHPGYIKLVTDVRRTVDKDTGEVLHSEYAPTVIELVLRNPITLNTHGEGDRVVENWHLYREFRPDEMFINNHAVYNATHPQADLKPLGDNGLSVLLPLLDGPLTIAEAAEETGHTYGAMARTIRRYAEHGLVDVTAGERNRKTYTLKEEWRTILQANRPRTTTYTVLFDRHVKALKSRGKYLRSIGEDERAAKVEAEMDRLKPVLDKAKARAGIVPYQVVRTNKEQERLRRLTHAYVTGERAEHRPKYQKQTATDQWRRKEYAKDRAAAECDWEEFNAWATVQHGPGWWVHKDITDVLGQYRVYEINSDHVPPIRWVGEQVAS